MTKPVKFTCALYNVDILICVGWPLDKFVKWAKRRGCSFNDDPAADAYYAPLDNHKHAIWLTKFDSNDFEDLLLLVHEVEHLTHSILEDCGIRVDYTTSDVSTHLMTWLLREIVRRLKPKVKSQHQEPKSLTIQQFNV
jgi:hypothetical protein